MKRLALPLAALGLLVLVAGLTLWSDGLLRQEAYPEYSVLNSSERGLSLAWAYLRRRGLQPRTLTRELGLSELPADGVVLRIRPAQELSPLAEWLLDLVSRKTEGIEHPAKAEKSQEPEDGPAPADENARARVAALRQKGRPLEDKNLPATWAARLLGRDDATKSASSEPLDAGGSEEDALDAGRSGRGAPEAGGAERGAGDQGPVLRSDGGLAPGASSQDGGGDGGAPDAGPGAGRKKPRKPRASLRDRLDTLERRWIARGGRLVLALDRDQGPWLLRQVDLPSGPVSKVHPLWPGLRRITPPRRRVLAPREPDEQIGLHGIFLLGDELIVARERIGRGELIVLACPEILQNQHLSEGDHLALLEAWARDESGQPRPVWFDERGHGLASSPSSFRLLRDAGLGPALLLAALLLGLLVWRRAVTLGPPAPEPAPRVVEALDFVDSLGGLYERALSGQELLRLYRERLRARVARSTGASGEALDRKMAGLLGLAPGEREPERGEGSFRARLRALNEACRRWDDAEHGRWTGARHE